MHGELAVPSRYRELAELIGPAATERLCLAYGGKSLYIPMMREAREQARKRRIQQEFLAGLDTTALAQKYGLTQRALQAMVKELRLRGKGAEA